MTSTRFDKAKEWFGTPKAAAMTLIWLCWVSFLASALIGVLYLLVLGVLALVD